MAVEGVVANAPKINPAKQEANRIVGDNVMAKMMKTLTKTDVSGAVSKNLDARLAKHEASIKK